MSPEGRNKGSLALVIGGERMNTDKLVEFSKWNVTFHHCWWCKNYKKPNPFPVNQKEWAKFYAAPNLFPCSSTPSFQRNSKSGVCECKNFSKKEVSK